MRKISKVLAAIATLGAVAIVPTTVLAKHHGHHRHHGHHGGWGHYGGWGGIGFFGMPFYNYAPYGYGNYVYYDNSCYRYIKVHTPRRHWHWRLIRVC